MRRKIEIAWKMIDLILLFAVLTILFYFGLVWLDNWQSQGYRYRQPGTDAVKVSAGTGYFDGHIGSVDKNDLTQRFIEFLRDGE